MVEESAKPLIDAGAVINDSRERGDDDEDAKAVFDSIGVMDIVMTHGAFFPIVFWGAYCGSPRLYNWIMSHCSLVLVADGFTEDPT